MSARSDGTFFTRVARFALTASLLATTPALAAESVVEKLDASPVQVETTMPAKDAIRERTWTQVVWDPGTSRLARRTYQLSDPLGDQNLDISWDGDAVSRLSDGPITGRGTLVWRTPGTPQYSEAARIAVYKGQMRNGRAHGRGTYTHRSGTSYSGEWRNGLMHGTGRIQFPNGDQYTGEFAAGEPEGRGLYVDTTGTIYEGGFAAGEREGAGELYPAIGDAFVATWRGGKPVSGSVRVLGKDEQRFPPLILTAYEAHDDIRVGVLVDRSYYAHVVAPAEPPVPYAANNKRDSIDIYPDDKRVIDAWRGSGLISMTEEEEFDYEASELGWGDNKEIPFGPGFLSTAGRVRPVPVVVELRNDSDQPLRIVNAFLDVAESSSEPEPAVQLRFGYMGDCGDQADFKADFVLENFGWTKAANAKVRFSFPNDPAREFVKEIGDIDPDATVDISDELKEIGFPVDRYKSGPIECKEGDYEKCAAEVKAADLSPLTSFAKLDAGHMRAPVKGKLEYEWTDSAGTTHTKSSPFEVNVILARMGFAAECGEGGNPQDRALKPFDLAIDKKNYRIMIPLRDDIPPGVTGRWRVRLQAPQSSSHDFHVVFELADGRQIASRPIDMLFFKPRIPGQDN
ncbi:MORN repeat-containing protein [Tepidamorphus sp. 3E244]|uniref:MORN repeat-containing protein n=1 Tax=Tepidamorphus sp. 3E244 TaxID=3385498 RepID=UPI0038FC2661